MAPAGPGSAVDHVEWETAELDHLHTAGIDL